jgi:hypothetical protein
MIVVGGTYDEVVVTPDSKDLMGSGMRAAAALAKTTDPPALHTVLDDDVDEEASFVAGALGVQLGASGLRDERVGFRYLTPISSPAINGPSSRMLDHPVASGTTALVFGLVEAPRGGFKVSADRIIFDPQKPRDTDPFQAELLDAKNLYIVANETEMRKLGASGHTVEEAVEGLLGDHPEVTGVVTKRGAVGSLVSRRSGLEVSHESVGAHPTTRVWPIGSGDTFSAGFAYALDQGADLDQAAEVGSASAAHWCSTRDPVIPQAILSGDFSSLPSRGPVGVGQVYLAAPFFSVAERWLVETVRDELVSLGVSVWSPVHEVGPGGDEVAQADLQGLRECDAVIALLDHGDPGTVFEVGWAVHRRIPVVGFATSFNPEGAKMMTGTQVEMHRDLATACYRAAWAAMGVRLHPGWAS